MEFDTGRHIIDMDVLVYTCFTMRTVELVKVKKIK